MTKEWMEPGDAICDGCGWLCTTFAQDDPIVDEENDEFYCDACAENIRRGKLMMSAEQREDLRQARKKNCAKCGVRLPIGRAHLFCRACSDETFMRFFGEQKFREMVLDRERRANG